MRVLASDEFEGRAPATEGEERTVQYLIEQFRSYGLQPGGVDGSWVQPVPLVRAQLDGPAKASLSLKQGKRALANGVDVTLQSLQPRKRVQIKDAPLVFVGYGIDAPERHWNDYKDVDLHGKIAVVLINDADFEADAPGAFDGKAVTYYGRWTYKFEEAARRGAEGVLIVHETAPAAYGWATVKSSGTSPLFDIERGQAEAMAQHTPLRGWMQRELAEAIFADAGLDFDAEKRKAMRADFRPVALDNAKLSVDFALKREQVVTRNVVAKLPGGEHADEAVIFSAHWDAFGIGQADAKGDRIRRGAIDNATGVATVLELGRVFAAGPQPQRTLYFVALTAEEKGLLGASYYAAHPLAPLDKTAAVLNIEMFSPDGATRDIASWGKGRVSLEGDLERVAKARGRSYSPDPNLEAGFFYRADHFALPAWACRRSPSARAWTSWTAVLKPAARCARSTSPTATTRPAMPGPRAGIRAATRLTLCWSTTWVPSWPTAAAGRRGRRNRSSAARATRAKRPAAEARDRRGVMSFRRG